MSHASGISASPDLVNEFNRVKDDPSTRFIKIQMEDVNLVAKHVGPKVSDQAADFEGLKAHLEEATPCFIVFRRDDTEPPSNWLLVMYVPDVAKVREKMLYASSRDALKRDLGSANFSAEMHACDLEEMSYESFQRQTLVSETDRLSLLSASERMREKELNTHVDTGISKSAYVHSVQFPLTDEAQAAIKSFSTKVANFVRLKVDQTKEVIDLDESKTLQGGFSGFKGMVCLGEEPRFCLYEHEQAEGAKLILFVFFCPEGAKVREKMLYSTAKAACIAGAEGLGVTVERKLEIRDNTDLTEQDFLPNEATPEPAAAAAISRPRGPGGRRGPTKVPVLPR